jgi:drug/metabolite transporter (DMT)-like permease
MTPGLGLALGAMLCFGLADVVYKRAAAAGAAPHRLIMIQATCLGACVLVYALVTRTLVPAAGAWWGAAAGVCAYTGYYHFARSLRAGNVSIVAPVFRLSFTLTAALAVLLLGEALTAPKIAGIALALVAVWLLLGAPGGATAADPRAVRGALGRVLLATTAVGLANLLYKVGLRAGATPGTMLVAQAACVIALSSLIARGIDGGFPVSGMELRFGTTTGLVLAGAFIFMMESLARGEASVLVPVVQMGFVVTAVVGFVFLGERFTARRGFGLALALAALASLAAA